MRFLTNPLPWLILLLSAVSCRAALKCGGKDVTAPVDRGAEIKLQEFVNDGHQPWRMDSESVAAEELIRLEYPDTRTSVTQVKLKRVTGSRTRAVYAWRKADGTRSYRIEVERPSWLLPTAKRYEWMIWVPVRAVLTECVVTQ